MQTEVTVRAFSLTFRRILLGIFAADSDMVVTDLLSAIVVLVESPLTATAEDGRSFLWARLFDVVVVVKVWSGPKKASVDAARSNTTANTVDRQVLTLRHAMLVFFLLRRLVRWEQLDP